MIDHLNLTDEHEKNPAFHSSASDTPMRDFSDPWNSRQDESRIVLRSLRVFKLERIEALASPPSSALTAFCGTDADAEITGDVAMLETEATLPSRHSEATA
jgi:hypothetical protein